MQGLAQAIDARALVRAVHARDGVVEIDVDVDPNAEAAPEPAVVAFMRIGMLSSWKFVL